MRKRYVIQWKSKVNGRAGKGTKLFDREEGQELVAELNRQYPDIEHELVDTESRSQPFPAMPQPERESEPEVHFADPRRKVLSFE